MKVGFIKVIVLAFLKGDVTLKNLVLLDYLYKFLFKDNAELLKVGL